MLRLRALAVFLLVIVLAPAAVPFTENRVALVIGNSQYEFSTPLPNPVNDAEGMTAKLSSLGFEVITALDLDLEGMREALDRFEEASADADIGLVFYAGHGLQLAGENYLLPVDASLRVPGDLTTAGFRVSEIHSALAAARPRLAVLILDACRDNPFAEVVDTGPGLATGSVPLGEPGRLNHEAGMLIAFAAAPGAVALDGVDGNSPFTTALLQWLDQPNLEMGLLFRRVRQTVLELTGGAQTPWVEEALLDDIYLNPVGPVLVAADDQAASFEVALWETIQQIPAALERQAALEFYDRLLPNNQFSEEARVQQASLAADEPATAEDVIRHGLAWLSIRDSDDPETFEAFLEYFPDSSFAPLARQRLAELEAAEAEEPELAALPALEAAPLLQPAQQAEPARPTAPSAESGRPTEVPAEGTRPTAVPAESVAPVELPVTALRPLEPSQPAQTPSDIVVLEVAPREEPADSRPPAVALGDDDVALQISPPPPLQPADSIEEEEVEPAPSELAADIPEEPVEIAPADPDPTPEEIEQALGLVSEHHAALQRLLAELGYYRDRVDGAFGPHSRAAVEDFQSTRNLPATGYLDADSLRRLVQEAAGDVLRRDIPRAERSDIHAVSAIGLLGPGNAPTRIRVASISRNDQIHDYWREVADRFEASHPGFEVEFSFQPGGPYKESLLMRLGSATPPDVIYTWGGGHLRALADAGFVRDLTSNMAEGWAMTFKPAALRNFTIGEQIYGVPMHMSLVDFWYNRPLFRDVGIDPDTIRTWDDLLEVVERLKRAGVAPIAVGGGDRWPLQFYWGSLAQRIGGQETFESALEGVGDGFAQPAFVQAGEMMRQLAERQPFQADFLQASDLDAVDTFARGEAAMVLAASWRLARMRWVWPGGPERLAEELGRLDFPAIAGGIEPAETYGGTDGWAVNSDAPDEAVAFVKTLAAADVQRTMAAMGYDVPAVAGADAALETAMLREVADELTNSRYHQLFYDQALGPEAGEVVNEISVALVQGLIDPAGAALRVEEAWELIRPVRGTLDPVPAPEPEQRLLEPAE